MTSEAAEIRVFSGGAPQETLLNLTPDFEKRTGHRVTYTFAHVSIIHEKLAAGEQADVLLLPTVLMNEAGKVIGLRQEGRSELARIGIGVLIQEGAPRPDISSADAIRQTLLEAKAIAVPRPQGLTGSHIARIMTLLGIDDDVRSKLRHHRAIEGAGELVAKGEVDVGMYLASEIHTVKGTTLVGMLPAELQNYVVYSIAIPQGNKTPGPALKYIEFVSAPENGMRWKEAGFEQLG
jgi:molybdate transport system substrate-binding protein